MTLYSLQEFVADAGYIGPIELLELAEREASCVDRSIGPHVHGAPCAATKALGAT